MASLWLPSGFRIKPGCNFYLDVFAATVFFIFFYWVGQSKLWPVVKLEQETLRKEISYWYPEHAASVCLAQLMGSFGSVSESLLLRNTVKGRLSECSSVRVNTNNWKRTNWPCALDRWWWFSNAGRASSARWRRVFTSQITYAVNLPSSYAEKKAICLF